MKGGYEGFLKTFGINSILIAALGSANNVYNNNVDDDLSYEFGLLSHAFDFLQHGDLSNPDTVRKFALFFQSTVEKYAIRYKVGGDEYTNASLGEIDKSLYTQDDPEKLKFILFVTAFYTRKCLLSTKNTNPINHINHGNHSIKYLVDKIVRNAMQCMIDKEMTDASVKTIFEDCIALVDIHTRGGTKEGGNDFEIFAGEVNEDHVLSSLCDEFEDDLRLREKIKFGNKTLETCKPILIDLLLGICNISLYAAYVTAMKTRHGIKEKLRIYMASTRSDFVFQQMVGNNAELKYGLLHLDIADVAFGPHPNSVQIYLTKLKMDVMEQLDKGITAVLQPLHGAPIWIKSNGAEIEAEFSTEEMSDFFQRLHHYRTYGDAKFDYDKDTDKITYQLLEQARMELSELRARTEKAREDRKAIDSETKAIQKESREDSKIIRTTTAQVVCEAKLQVSRKRQQEKSEATNKTRNDWEEAGNTGLQDLLASVGTNTDDNTDDAKQLAKRTRK